MWACVPGEGDVCGETASWCLNRRPSVTRLVTGGRQTAAFCVEVTVPPGMRGKEGRERHASETGFICTERGIFCEGRNMEAVTEHRRAWCGVNMASLRPLRSSNEGVAATFIRPLNDNQGCVWCNVVYGVRCGEGCVVSPWNEPPAATCSRRPRARPCHRLHLSSLPREDEHFIAMWVKPLFRRYAVLGGTAPPVTHAPPLQH